MTTASYVLALVGALIAAYGSLLKWRRTSEKMPNRLLARLRQLGDKTRRWLRFGRPMHHTIDAHLTGTGTFTADLGLIRGGTEREKWLRIDGALDALARAQAEDRANMAEQIKQGINDYRDEELANTRRDTLITGIGLVMTIAGILLRVLAG